ncbi:MAG: nucleoside phosphorylase [Peptococcaceae bacterium]|nr:nucleoside phosphorylase [Peptococcaceae bacterium]
MNEPLTIIDAFDNNTEAVINPAHIAPPVDGFPTIAVVAFSERMIAALREHYEPVLINKMIAGVTVPVYKINRKGRDMAVYCSTIGGPAAAGLMEEMISKGCKRFVFFGSCGVLNRELAAKSLIVPTAAYRDEGTSYHYAPPGEYIDVVTAPKLAAILSELNLPYACGKTWTTDAIYRETRGNMEKRKNDGCVTVEMECASVMSVARFRNVEAYQYFYAADCLDEAEWDIRTLGSLTRDAYEKFLRVALEIAARI